MWDPQGERRAESDPCGFVDRMLRGIPSGQITVAGGVLEDLGVALGKTDDGRLLFRVRGGAGAGAAVFTGPAEVMGDRANLDIRQSFGFFGNAQATWGPARASATVRASFVRMGDNTGGVYLEPPPAQVPAPRIGMTSGQLETGKLGGANAAAGLELYLATGTSPCRSH